MKGYDALILKKPSAVMCIGTDFVQKVNFFRLVYLLSFTKGVKYLFSFLLSNFVTNFQVNS